MWGWLFLENLIKEPDNSVQPNGGDYSKYKCEEAKSSTGFPITHINLEEKLDCYQNSSFDLVYAGEVIEHLYNPDNMVKEICRILKQNGYFILSTPNMNSWISRFFFCFLGIYPLNCECSTESS